jgi:hypothetical protein
MRKDYAVRAKVPRNRGRQTKCWDKGFPLCNFREFVFTDFRFEAVTDAFEIGHSE